MQCSTPEVSLADGYFDRDEPKVSLLSICNVIGAVAPALVSHRFELAEGYHTPLMATCGKSR
jgi:hypothetical protein